MGDSLTITDWTFRILFHLLLTLPQGPRHALGNPAGVGFLSGKHSYARIGGTAFINCSYANVQHLSIQWERQECRLPGQYVPIYEYHYNKPRYSGSRISRAKLDLGSGRNLAIKNTTKDFAGQYRCRDLSNKLASSLRQLSLTEMPKIYNDTSMLNTLAETILRCTATTYMAKTAEPDPALTWRLNGRVIDRVANTVSKSVTDSRRSCRSKSSIVKNVESRLSYRFKPADNNKYLHCTLKKPDGTTWEEAKQVVRVYYGPSTLTVQLDKAPLSGTTIMIDKGSTHEITCLTDDVSQRASVTWSFGEGTQEPIQEVPAECECGTVFSRTLSITGNKEQRLTCTARNLDLENSELLKWAIDVKLKGVSNVNAKEDDSESKYLLAIIPPVACAVLVLIVVVLLLAFKYHKKVRSSQILIMERLELETQKQDDNGENALPAVEPILAAEQPKAASVNPSKKVVTIVSKDDVFEDLPAVEMNPDKVKNDLIRLRKMATPKSSSTVHPLVKVGSQVQMEQGDIARGSLDHFVPGKHGTVAEESVMTSSVETSVVVLDESGTSRKLSSKEISRGDEKSAKAASTWTTFTSDYHSKPDKSEQRISIESFETDISTVAGRSQTTTELDGEQVTRGSVQKQELGALSSLSTFPDEDNSEVQPIKMGNTENFGQEGGKDSEVTEAPLDSRFSEILSLGSSKVTVEESEASQPAPLSSEHELQNVAETELTAPLSEDGDKAKVETEPLASGTVMVVDKSEPQTLATYVTNIVANSVPFVDSQSVLPDSRLKTGKSDSMVFDKESPTTVAVETREGAQNFDLVRPETSMTETLREEKSSCTDLVSETTEVTEVKRKEDSLSSRSKSLKEGKSSASDGISKAAEIACDKTVEDSPSSSVKTLRERNSSTTDGISEGVEITDVKTEEDSVSSCTKTLREGRSSVSDGISEAGVITDVKTEEDTVSGWTKASIGERSSLTGGLSEAVEITDVKTEEDTVSGWTKASIGERSSLTNGLSEAVEITDVKTENDSLSNWTVATREGKSGVTDEASEAAEKLVVKTEEDAMSSWSITTKEDTSSITDVRREDSVTSSSKTPATEMKHLSDIKTESSAFSDTETPLTELNEVGDADTILSKSSSSKTPLTVVTTLTGINTEQSKSYETRTDLTEVFALTDVKTGESVVARSERTTLSNVTHVTETKTAESSRSDEQRKPATEEGDCDLQAVCLNEKELSCERIRRWSEEADNSWQMGKKTQTRASFFKDVSSDEEDVWKTTKEIGSQPTVKSEIESFGIGDERFHTAEKMTSSPDSNFTTPNAKSNDEHLHEDNLHQEYWKPSNSSVGFRDNISSEHTEQTEEGDKMFNLPSNHDKESSVIEEKYIQVLPEKASGLTPAAEKPKTTTAPFSTKSKPIKTPTQHVRTVKLPLSRFEKQKEVSHRKNDKSGYKENTKTAIQKTKQIQQIAKKGAQQPTQRKPRGRTSSFRGRRSSKGGPSETESQKSGIESRVSLTHGGIGISSKQSIEPQVDQITRSSRTSSASQREAHFIDTTNDMTFSVEETLQPNASGGFVGSKMSGEGTSGAFSEITFDEQERNEEFFDTDSRSLAAGNITEKEVECNELDGYQIDEERVIDRGKLSQESDFNTTGEDVSKVFQPVYSDQDQACPEEKQSQVEPGVKALSEDDIGDGEMFSGWDQVAEDTDTKAKSDDTLEHSPTNVEAKAAKSAESCQLENSTDVRVRSTEEANDMFEADKAAQNVQIQSVLSKEPVNQMVDQKDGSHLYSSFGQTHKQSSDQIFSKEMEATDKPEADRVAQNDQIQTAMGRDPVITTADKKDSSDLPWSSGKPHRQSSDPKTARYTNADDEPGQQSAENLKPTTDTKETFGSIHAYLEHRQDSDSTVKLSANVVHHSVFPKRIKDLDEPMEHSVSGSDGVAQPMLSKPLYSGEQLFEPEETEVKKDDIKDKKRPALAPKSSPRGNQQTWRPWSCQKRPRDEKPSPPATPISPVPYTALLPFDDREMAIVDKIVGRKIELEQMMVRNGDFKDLQSPQSSDHVIQPFKPVFPPIAPRYAQAPAAVITTQKPMDIGLSEAVFRQIPAISGAYNKSFEKAKTTIKKEQEIGRGMKRETMPEDEIVKAVVQEKGRRKDKETRNYEEERAELVNKLLQKKEEIRKRNEAKVELHKQQIIEDIQRENTDADDILEKLIKGELRKSSLGEEDILTKAMEANLAKQRFREEARKRPGGIWQYIKRQKTKPADLDTDFKTGKSKPTKKKIKRNVDFIQRPIGVSPTYGLESIDEDCGFVKSLKQRRYGTKIFQYNLAKDKVAKRGSSLSRRGSVGSRARSSTSQQSRHSSQLEDLKDIASRCPGEQRTVEMKLCLLSMDRELMLEIRDYARPPPGVHEVMVATMLLLGEDERVTRVWEDCQKLCQTIRTMDYEGLFWRIMKFDVLYLHPMIASRALDILSPFTEDKILDVSIGATMFYVWTKTFCQESIDKAGYKPKAANRRKQGKLIDRVSKALEEASNEVANSYSWGRKNLKKEKEKAREEKKFDREALGRGIIGVERKTSS